MVDGHVQPGFVSCCRSWQSFCSLNIPRQAALPRHDHHLCPDSDGEESCRKDRQGEDQSTCYGIDGEWRSVHWLHLREKRSYFQEIWSVIFASGGFSADFTNNSLPLFEAVVGQTRKSDRESESLFSCNVRCLLRLPPRWS